MSSAENLERVLFDIAGRATTLGERLQRGTVPQRAGIDDAVVQKRLEMWCQAVAKGDWAKFRKRLTWDGLDVHTARAALGPASLDRGTPLPDGITLLREALDAAVTSSGGAVPHRMLSEERFLDPRQPLPFQEILAPFVRLARQRLVRQAGDHYDLLPDPAHSALERSLLQVLTACAGQTLYLEFSLLRAQKDSTLGRLFAMAVDDDSRSLYQRFTEQLLQDGLVSFFHEYAVLARLLATIVSLWADSNAEFLERLALDRPELERMFGELGPVIAIEPSLSDPHQGRRRVIELAFASGRKLIYKPKDLGMEQAYNRLLGCLNELGPPLPFKVLKVLNRSTHGWVEFVDHRACSDNDAARRYYLRAGMLLCLAYVLEGTDCHRENLIASGEHPVLVDPEALLQHRPMPSSPTEMLMAPSLANDQFAHSVLRTALLPVWQLGPDGRIAYDASGLGSAAEQESPFGAPRWDRVNTDCISLDCQTGIVGPGANVPFLDGGPLRIGEFKQELLAGFRNMYQFLIDHREALLSPDSPLQELGLQQVRFVHRPTKVYAVILTNLFAPDYLRDGADRGIHLELLSRAFIASEEKPASWPVLAAEQQAMEAMDVPFFTAPANGRSLEIGPGETIEGSFPEPSFGLVVARLRALGDQDLEAQLTFIEGALYAHFAREGDAMTEHIATVAEETPRKLDFEEVVNAGLAVAGELRRRAIRGFDQSASWVGPQYLPRAKRYQFQPVGHDLYAGAAGIGLFLAAAEKVASGAGCRDLALGAVEPLRRALETDGDRLAGDLGIGGAAGLGGLVYALVRMAQFLEAPTLLQDAYLAASLITEERISTDRVLDVIGGAAGAMLGLRKLHDATSDPAILDRATACGEHLLKMRRASEKGLRAWAASGGKLLTGFSHGAAGIAYALLRLYEAARDARFIEAAGEAIAYEDSVFSAEACNWPDLQQSAHPAFVVRWCHGAPGIGLGRVGGLTALETPRIRQDIDTAIETTRRFGIEPIDHLCCGNLGRIEFLLVAGRRLSRPDLRDLAHAWTAEVMARARQRGSFGLHPLLPKEVYCPGFFQGMAGIGYEMLRLAYPESLPSVLLWE